MYLFFTCSKLVTDLYFADIDVYYIMFHIFIARNAQFVKIVTLKKHIFFFKYLKLFGPFPSTRIKFGFYPFNPKLRECFLLFPVPVPKLFGFSRSRPKMQKVVPAHAWSGKKRSKISIESLQSKSTFQTLFLTHR